MLELIIVGASAFLGCAAAGFAGHYWATRALTVYFDELEQRLQPTVHEITSKVVGMEHKTCDVCKSVVARYEEIKGKIVCANCKGKK